MSEAKASETLFVLKWNDEADYRCSIMLFRSEDSAIIYALEEYEMDEELPEFKMSYDARFAVF